MGGLLGGGGGRGGGPKGMLAPLSNYWGGGWPRLPPPVPTPMGSKFIGMLAEHAAGIHKFVKASTKTKTCNRTCIFEQKNSANKINIEILIKNNIYVSGYSGKLQPQCMQYSR